MDETAKDEARNYITASGFFVMGTTWLFSLILTLSGGGTSDIDSAVYFIVSGGMVIIATLLAVLRKRDLIVIFFLVIVLQNLLRGFQIDDLYGAISVLFFLLVALLNMSLKNKAVLYLWMFPIVLIVLNVNHLLIHSEVLDIICFAAYVFLHYYSAIARAAERINLPLSRAFKS
ncbi:MAG TPA: hypothetical protein O0X42_04440, partial [Methanocorpusculum sp.]|nr:hypothetical protein [Methanocorpusculum sp.]